MRKIYPSNYEQDFAGFWDDLTNVFKSSVDTFKSWAGDVYKTASQYAKETQEWISKGQNYIQSKYDEVIKNMNEAEKNDKIIKEALNKMPQSPEKMRLQAEHKESTNILNNYVRPMWNEFVKQISKPTMGALPAVLPVLGYATAGILVALSSYVVHVIVKQQRMLNDPELKKYVAQDTGIFSNLSNITANLKWPIIIGSVAVLAYYANKNFGKR
jgi:L-fucose isomerase-like protein